MLEPQILLRRLIKHLPLRRIARRAKIDIRALERIRDGEEPMRVMTVCAKLSDLLSEFERPRQE